MTVDATIPPIEIPDIPTIPGLGAHESAVSSSGISLTGKEAKILGRQILSKTLSTWQIILKLYQDTYYECQTSSTWILAQCCK